MRCLKNGYAENIPGPYSRAKRLAPHPCRLSGIGVRNITVLIPICLSLARSSMISTSASVATMDGPRWHQARRVQSKHSDAIGIAIASNPHRPRSRHALRCKTGASITVATTIWAGLGSLCFLPRSDFFFVALLNTPKFY